MTDNRTFVPRTCRKVDSKTEASHPLTFYADYPAYVLLADPGMGKTTLFKQAGENPENEYIRAGDFFTEKIESGSSKTWFIDALDEAQPGTLDKIREKLHHIGNPRFRIACRAADWLGISNIEDLERASPNQKLVVLELNPLGSEDISIILQSRRIDNPDAFCNAARQNGLFDLLRNPKILELIISVVIAEGKWPENRKEVYEKACHTLIKEHNDRHDRLNPAISTHQLMNAAGYLCAIQLFSGKQGFTLRNNQANDEYYNIQDLPSNQPPALQQVLKTKLFHTDDQERSSPVHRSLAEYLAAHYLASLIEEAALPFGRVKALLLDSQGKIAFGLHGLAAWLAVESVQSQDALLDLDPLAILAYETSSLLPKENLKTILDRVQAGKIEDTDDALLGLLLNALYPQVITPRIILNYFRPAKNAHLVGPYQNFWYKKFLKTETKYLPDLLDALVQKHSELVSAPTDYMLESIVEELLLKGLKNWGEKATAEKLYQWLILGVGEYGQPWFGNKEAPAIADWFSEHPAQYKAVIRYGAAVAIKQENFNLSMWNCQTRLQGACPPDIAIWYVEQAKKEVSLHKKLGQYYLSQAALKLRQGEGLPNQALDLLNSAVNEFPDLLGALNGVTWVDVDDTQMKHAYETHKNWKLQDAEKKRKRAEYFRQHEEAMRKGTASVAVLYNLGQAYKGRFSDIHGTTPDARLQDLLGDDEALIAAANLALSSVLTRNDLPSVKEIINLMAIEGKFLVICSACLVNIAKMYEADPLSVLSLDNTVLEKVLAFYFTDDIGEQAPEWLSLLLKERPELYKKVLHEYGLAMIRAKKEYIYPLYRLISDERYAHLAPTLIPEFLKRFPVRISEQMLNQVLVPLLQGALTHAVKQDLIPLINNRLAKKSMDEAQKIYWLASAFILEAESYQESLRACAIKSQTRLKDLGAFLQKNWHSRFYGNLKDTLLSFLIELFAPTCSPERPLGAFIKTQATETVDLVYAMIHEFRDNSTRTSKELTHLLELKHLERWQPVLREALLFKQGKSIIDIQCLANGFKYPSVPKICNTLANKAPANPADLAELTFEVLKDIAREIQTSQGNIFSFFWNGNEPKLEKDCCNVLSTLLDNKLKQHKSQPVLQPELVYNKKPDIMVVFESFCIPIEIKKDCTSSAPERDVCGLWDGIHNQLISKYTCDPRSGGYGIYVVFWFGGKNQPRTLDGNRIKPKTPEELQHRLQNTLRTKEEKERIKILVIDCSHP